MTMFLAFPVDWSKLAQKLPLSWNPTSTSDQGWRAWRAILSDGGSSSEIHSSNTPSQSDFEHHLETFSASSYDDLSPTSPSSSSSQFSCPAVCNEPNYFCEPLISSPTYTLSPGSSSSFCSLSEIENHQYHHRSNLQHPVSSFPYTNLESDLNVSGQHPKRQRII